MSESGPCSCASCRPLLGDFVEGDLDTMRAARIQAHLAACPACEVFVQKLRNATAACRAHLLRQVPKGLENRLMSFLREKCVCPSAKSAADSTELADDTPDSPAGDLS